MIQMTSAQEAIKVAEDFLGPYYPWRQPVKAVREGDVWTVEFDVGAVKVQIVSLKIDAKTREIRELIRPSISTVHTPFG